MTKHALHNDPFMQHAPEPSVAELGKSSASQPVEEPQEAESLVRPPINSVVNPGGMPVEPIAEAVKRQEQSQQPSAKQPAASPQQTKHKSGSTNEDIMYRRNRPEDSLEGTDKSTDNGERDRHMQSDMRYTSTMKKQKDMGTNEAEKKVQQVAARSDNVLMKIKAVFPFDLFPDTVIVDANKVSIVDKYFFASESVTSILLEEITDVVVESNFFLAKLNITYSHHPLQPKHHSVAALHKKEALKVKEIIQGLLVLRLAEGIDLSKLKPEEIIQELTRIGKTHEPISSL